MTDDVIGRKLSVIAMQLLLQCSRSRTLLVWCVMSLAACQAQPSLMQAHYLGLSFYTAFLAVYHVQLQQHQ